MKIIKFRSEISSVNEISLNDNEFQVLLDIIDYFNKSYPIGEKLLDNNILNFT
jgi:hypothetical protein